MQDTLDSMESWEQLMRYSLLEKQEDGKGYSMHRLLQEVVRYKITHEREWALCCLSLFIKAYDFTYGNCRVDSFSIFSIESSNVASTGCK